MAVTSPVGQTSTMLSQAELYRRLDPKGNVADICEALNQSNEIIQDVTMKEGNLPNGDQQSIRTGLPDVYWRQLNRGVPPSHSTVANVQETCAEMSAQSIIDVQVCKLNGNDAAFRRSEEKPFIESMGQKFATTMFYGDASKEDGFTGLATRYSTTSVATAACAKNVINCGGTAQSNKLTSIYLVSWGDNVYCPYPKGSKVGLETRDLGQQLVDDDLGNKMLAYVTMYSWHVGLMIRDWRYVVRLANIDVDALYAGTGIGTGDIKTANTTNLILKLQTAIAKIPVSGKANIKIYMNGDVHDGLGQLAARTNNNVLAYHDAQKEYGTHGAWSTFAGIPIRRCDAISNAESVVA